MPLLSEAQLVTALLGQLAGLGFASGWDDVIRLGFGRPQTRFDFGPQRLHIGRKSWPH